MQARNIGWEGVCKLGILAGRGLGILAGKVLGILAGGGGGGGAGGCAKLLRILAAGYKVCAS